ncbi:MAG: prepilin-type N-terminal cleavage/methylation domain-containing protein [Patescibacteria group bacterium]|nr:prepilin-type N-terminal cleavage/methylation domain-containing protein [Patescibacteria group bacterium]MDD5715597.1 prepilin-type N-terminal cleavage/methylation domain-containing protein [Patescibacteria group bacterium]
MRQRAIRTESGFTLVEVLVVLLIFSALFILMLNAFDNSFKGLQRSKAKLLAVEIANSQMEVLRNIDYYLLGTTTGSPQGSIQPTREQKQSGVTYTIATTIKYFDDPFDGCAGLAVGLPPEQWSQCADGSVVEKPRDIPANQNNPADYKKCDVVVSWSTLSGDQSIKLSTIIAPQDLEGDTDKGFLLIKVIDANGAPVSGATVSITNTTVSPAVNLSMATNVLGQLLLLDLEPSQFSYVIRVAKDGYTTSRTCSMQTGGTACTDAEGVPDPVLRDVSVHEGELDEVTFIIDKFSTLAVNSYNEFCEALDGIDFTLRGMDKKISNDPEIFKNVISFTTNALLNPHWSTAELEWDRYDLVVDTPGYDIAGINHDLALDILPNTSTTINVLLAPHTENSLLVTAKDSGTRVNVSDVTVRGVNTGETFDQSKITGQGFIQQTDWSGGFGQELYTDETRYFSGTNVDTASTTGQVTLQKVSMPYSFEEDFSTGNYKDGGSTTADWNVPDQELRMDIEGGVYPVGTVQYMQTKPLNGQYGKISSATLTATEALNGQTIRYYLSADGGTTFEQVTLGTLHVFAAAGDELHVRIEMETTDEDVTPVVSDFEVQYELDTYAASGELESSTIDLGSAAEGHSDFTTLAWDLVAQPAETGETSVRFQIATNSDNSTWTYVGPDGTSATYFEGAAGDVHSSHDGNRYLRYKMFLSTEDIYYTPTVTDIRIGYTLECLPPGQAYFSDMPAGDYVLELHHPGYQDVNQTIKVSGYTTVEVLLTPLP